MKSYWNPTGSMCVFHLCVCVSERRKWHARARKRGSLAQRCQAVPDHGPFCRCIQSWQGTTSGSSSWGVHFLYKKSNSSISSYLGAFVLMDDGLFRFVATVDSCWPCWGVGKTAHKSWPLWNKHICLCHQHDEYQEFQLHCKTKTENTALGSPKQIVFSNQHCSCLMIEYVCACNSFGCLFGCLHFYWSRRSNGLSRIAERLSFPEARHTSMMRDDESKTCTVGYYYRHNFVWSARIQMSCSRKEVGGGLWRLHEVLCPHLLGCGCEFVKSRIPCF